MNVNKSPANRPWVVLFTVTVAEVSVVSNVQPVSAVSKGVIS